MAVAGLCVGGILGALSALLPGRSGSSQPARRGVLGPQGPGPAWWWGAGAAARLTRAAAAACRRQPGDALGAFGACRVAAAAVLLVQAAAAASCRRLGDAPRASHAFRAAGAAPSAGASLGAGGSGPSGAAWGCLAGGSAETAASARCRLSLSAGVSPSHPWETGERERDRRRGWSSRWGGPSESDILAALSGRCMLCVARLCVSRCPSSPPVRRCCAVGGAVRFQGLGGWPWSRPRWSQAIGHPLASGREAREPRVPFRAPGPPAGGGAQGPGPTGVIGGRRGEPH